MNNTLVKTALYIIGIFGLICLFLQLTGRMVHKKPTRSDDLLGDVLVRAREGAPGPPGPHAAPMPPMPPQIPRLKQPEASNPTKVRVPGTNMINELPPTRNPPIVPEMAPVTVGPEPFQI